MTELEELKADLARARARALIWSTWATAEAGDKAGAVATAADWAEYWGEVERIEDAIRELKEKDNG